MKTERSLPRSNPRPAQVRHLRRKHGLSENTAMVIAELHYGVRK
jgi:hypothetical protein